MGWGAVGAGVPHLGGVVASWGCFRGCVLFDFPVAYVVVCAIIGVRRLVDGRWF